jgi:hypothetical protein
MKTYPPPHTLCREEHENKGRAKYGKVKRVKGKRLNGVKVQEHQRKGLTCQSE